MGVLLIVLGAYLFQLEEVGKGVLAPARALARQPGVLLAIGASFVWGLTPIFEKIAIQHTTPENPLLVAFATTLLTVVLLTPALWRSATNPIGQMRQHRGGFVLAGLISGIAPLFGFSAIALGYVGYVTALFKLGAALTVTRQFFVVDLRHLDTAKIPLDSWSLRVYTLLNNSINLLNIGI